MNDSTEALGRWLGWVGITYVRRHHEHYHRRAGGHLYQGRFKSFPVSSDEHFLTLCRYVEANPRRAKLVDRAERWQWSELRRRARRAGGLPLAKWPIRRPADWLAWVNRDSRLDALAQLRECVQRGGPLGDRTWAQATAARLGLGFTLRGPGRPGTRNQ